MLRRRGFARTAPLRHADRCARRQFIRIRVARVQLDDHYAPSSAEAHGVAGDARECPRVRHGV